LNFEADAPRPEVHSWRQYSFAGSITLVFASGVGLCPSALEDSLNCAVSVLRAAAARDGRSRTRRSHTGSGRGGRLRRPGQGEARGTSPRATLSSLAERLNDGRLPDGEVVANLESEIRKLCEVGGRRFRVALLPTEIPASREPGLRLNPQLGRIPAKMRAELTSAEIAMSGSYFDDVLRDPRRYGIENTTDKVRRPGAVRRRRDAVCTVRFVASLHRKCVGAQSLRRRRARRPRHFR
jgi:hypothetical protein